MKPLTLLLFLLAGCSERKPMKKPFIVVDKYTNWETRPGTSYRYQDANGQQMSFLDKEDKYNVGDTLK